MLEYLRLTRRNAANRGFTLIELMIVVVIVSVVALLVVAGVVLTVLYLSGHLSCTDGAAVSDLSTGHSVVLGGDVDESAEDVDFYGGVDSSEDDSESSQESPYDYARKCGRKNCRIVRAERSDSKSVSDPIQHFASHESLNG